MPGKVEWLRIALNRTPCQKTDGQQQCGDYNACYQHFCCFNPEIRRHGLPLSFGVGELSPLLIAQLMVKLMATILDEIVATKLSEIEATKQRVPESQLERWIEDYHPPTRDFTSRINVPGVVSVIAEIKKASPSAGVIRADFDPVKIAWTYCRHGVAAISVLTDWQYFQGELYTIALLNDTDIRKSLPPILRKDFILDRYQLLESRARGADAVLLIAECLPGGSLDVLYRAATKLGLHTLVELHDADQLQRVLDTGCPVIGINNRDLRTFNTRLEHTLELLPRIPSDRVVVSESGIASHADLVRLGKAGVKAVLVGESLMRAPDIGAALDALLGR
jgi:indole-3-glycerol phosphate synthase